MPDRPYSRQTKSPSRLWLEEKDTRNVLTMKLKKLQEAKDPQSEKFVCWCRRAATPISSTSHAKNKLQIGKLLFCFEKRNSYGFIFIVFIYLSRWSGDRNEKNVVVDCYGFSCLRGFFSSFVIFDENQTCGKSCSRRFDFLWLSELSIIFIDRCSVLHIRDVPSLSLALQVVRKIVSSLRQTVLHDVHCRNKDDSDNKNVIISFQVYCRLEVLARTLLPHSRLHIVYHVESGEELTL